MPIVIAYTDTEGAARSGPRGSTHVFDESRLCVWVANPADSLCTALGSDDRVLAIYRNPLECSFYRMDGRARLATEAADNERIYSTAPMMEQRQDPERRGVGVIIDVIRIAGNRMGDEPVLIGPPAERFRPGWVPRVKPRRSG